MKTSLFIAQYPSIHQNIAILLIWDICLIHLRRIYYFLFVVCLKLFENKEKRTYKLRKF